MCWAVRRFKIENIFDHGYFLSRHSGLSKALDDVRIHAPSHRTDEAFRRRRRKRGAYLQQLRHERSCIVWNPVTHHNATARFCDPNHLLGYVEGLGSKHGAEYGEGQIKRMIADPLQVAGVSFLKFQSFETRPRSAFVSGVDEVLGNVDSNNFSPQKGERNRRRAVSATEV